MPERQLRIVHCPAVVGGHAIGLARAERSLGLDSRAIVFEQPPFGYAADQVLFARASRPARELRRWRFLVRVLRSADVVHFNFGSSIAPRYWPSARGSGLRRAYGLYARLLEGRDLALFGRARKAIFVTYQGDDARQAATFAGRLDDPAWLDRYFDPADDERKRRMIGRFDRHADGIYALNPDLLDALPTRAELLPYASVDVQRVRPVPFPRRDGLVVAHAPTHRVAKGTKHLIAAVERLKEEGLDLELRLIEGVSHDEARRRLADADVVVDQLVSGWYGGVAVETMALGRPALAFLHDADLARLPVEMRADLPIVNVRPETLAEALRALVEGGRARLAELGERSRSFVERWHDPLRVAARTAAAYEAAVSSRRSATSRTSSKRPST